MNTTPRRDTSRPRVALALTIAAGLAIAGCAPGDDDAAEPDDTAADDTSAAGDTSGTDAAPDEAQDCGTDDVVMNAYFETGFELPFSLSEEFTRQYPNVTWDIKQDQFSNLISSTPRLLAGDNPPDLIRLPTMVSLVQDDLLENLDGYAASFGWDEFPEAQLSQNRVDDSGVRGSGSLYAMGLNYSLTGVFYNRELAEQVGMTEAPQTVEEFDAVLASAKEQDIQPIMAWNASASGGGLAFPLQQLMASYGSSTEINSWIFQQPDTTIDTESNLAAAEHLQGWIEEGYFPEDANAIEYTDANARFRSGEGLFIFNGDWENAGYDGEMGDNVGFLLFPPLEAGGPYAAMSAPNTYGIGAGAPNADCAAFFLDWVATNPEARQISVDVGGSSPGGPADLEVPPVDEGSVTSQTLEAGASVAADDGQMDFIANATGAIFAEGWTPELQKMIGGQQDAAGLLSSVQAEYERQLEG